jgi:hypothetical protein
MMPPVAIVELQADKAKPRGRIGEAVQERVVGGERGGGACLRRCAEAFEKAEQI